MSDQNESNEQTVSSEQLVLSEQSVGQESKPVEKVQKQKNPKRVAAGKKELQQDGQSVQQILRNLKNKKMRNKILKNKVLRNKINPFIK